LAQPQSYQNSTVFMT